MADIRKLRPEETDKAVALFLFFQEDDGVKSPSLPSVAHVADMLHRDEFHVVVALEGDRVVGGLTAYEMDRYKDEERELFLFEIAVHPGFRRLGIGKRLIAFARNICTTRGLDKMYVFTSQSNKPAMRLYTCTGGQSDLDGVGFTYLFPQNQRSSATLKGSGTNPGRLSESLVGEKVVLTAATPEDKRDAWETGFNSDTTSSMAGPPLYPEKPPGTYQEFCDDWKPYYFDGSLLLLGRIFKILVDGKRVGYVTYNDIDIRTSRVEVDIWLSSESLCGKGYGSDALRTLCRYVHSRFGVREVFIQPSQRNPRAIRAYEKAGFVRLEISIEAAEKLLNSTRDCYDSVYMTKQMNA